MTEGSVCSVTALQSQIYVSQFNENFTVCPYIPCHFTVYPYISCHFTTIPKQNFITGLSAHKKELKGKISQAFNMKKL